MKKILFLILGVLIALPGMSRDFTYTYEGQTLKYRVLDETAKTCEIQFGNNVSGNLIIPSIAKDGGKEYTVTQIGTEAFSGCSGLTSVTIPNSVTTIGGRAFLECSGLTSVTIPNSVTTIDGFAFTNCSGLTSVTIPASVTTIDTYAFFGCRGLTSVTIGNSVTTIGGAAFQACSGLTTVTIPESVTTIGQDAFNGCSGLTKVDFASIEALCKINFGNASSNPLYYAHNLYINGEEVKSVVIPETVTTIGSRTFIGCWSINELIIEDGKETLSLSGDVFNDCPLETLYLGRNLSYYPFKGKTSLKTLTIGNSVTSIGSSAFSNCSGLTSVIIPNSVISIGQQAFYWCSGLTSVTIPESVISIGSSAFNGCYDLKNVIYTADNPIEGSGDMFSEMTYLNATLFMSDNGMIAASTRTPWKYFQKIEKYDPAGVEEVSADIDWDMPYEIYNCSGVKEGIFTGQLAPGIYIVRQGNAVKKIMVK